MSYKFEVVSYEFEVISYGFKGRGRSCYAEL